MRHHLWGEMNLPILFCLMLLSISPAYAEHLLEEYYLLRFDIAHDAEPDVSHLLILAEQACHKHPNDADAWLSVGVLRAAHAKSLGFRGLSALKQARRDLERSIELDASWMGGYAKAFLARLYLTVPSWPLSFGSDKTGSALLDQVLLNAPSSLPGNLYEGLRLKGQQKSDAAARHLRLAASVKLACACPSWQRYLREQAQTALQES